MKTLKIEKVETFTIKFINERGDYKMFINGKVIKNDLMMPSDETLKIARTLGRFALTFWMYNDKLQNEK